MHSRSQSRPTLASIAACRSVFVPALALLSVGWMAPRLAAQCNTQWLPLGTGLNNNVYALTVLPNGDVVAGGAFTTAGGSAANYVARWDGTAWSPLGTGMNNHVLALTALPNGDVVAGGIFTAAGGVAANYIARWDGTAWSPLGAGTKYRVFALTTLANGDVIAGGSFATAGGVAAENIARWDGTTWSPLGTGVTGGAGPPINAAPFVADIVELPNGDLVVGGGFYLAGAITVNHIARWDGTAWSPFGTGVSGPQPIGVDAVIVLPNGDIVVGGNFTTAGGVAASKLARWNGTAWSQLGTGVFGVVTALKSLPDGDVVPGGTFGTPGGGANNIARWDGTGWSPFGAGVGGSVYAFTTLPNGDLVVGGNFTSPGARVVQLTTTCPAFATTRGNGCPSSGGNNTLVSTTPPWVDATWRTTGSGLPTTAIVVAATSFTAIAQGATPLSALLPPLGVPGCDLLVQPDILHMIVTTNGIAQFQAFLPNTPPLVGLNFYHQMVPIEVDTNGNWVAITATNALQLTAGMF